ncbi:hypothetical protein T01_4319, partial [Trichinella spiralis]
MVPILCIYANDYQRKAETIFFSLPYLTLKLSFALDYRLMTKNDASFGASTFLTVTCTREQQSHAT